MRPFFTDARTYVNQSNKTYDVILVDVYGDASIPFSLMTTEYGRAVSQRLKPGGLLVANIIGSLHGDCRTVLAALDASYRTYLPYAHYAGRPDAGPGDRANYVVTYSKNEQPVKGLKLLPSFNQKVFTDNYAPAERLYYDCEQQT